ncbi:MAG: hypothetical protein K2J95_10615 [Lachnospiraceae bacterium]|nr:hypothetical protein [Lachnospiraceae bacterium]
MQKPALKSAQEKAERQQNAAGQIEFWEKQKENLKNMECSTLEDIAKKLDKLDSYENEIAAVKMQYNQEQMRRAMDEAKEIGEKIAEEAEKLEPKTAEERREEMAEEALGTDEEKGVLSEIMEDLSQLAEELTEEVTELDLQEELSQENLESADSLSEAVSENALAQEQLPSQPVKYKRIDLLI